MEYLSLTRKILDFLNNKSTKVEQKTQYKTNSYNYLTDTIYLAENIDEQKPPRGIEVSNPLSGQLIMLCHECIHSIQNKFFHVLNIITANLSLIITFICVVLRIIDKTNSILSILGLVICFINLTVRTLLEYNAIKESMILSKKLVNNNIVDFIKEEEIEKDFNIIKKLLPIALTRMVIEKYIMMLIIICVI